MPNNEHLVVVRQDPDGAFTAEALGLPQVRATESSREEAINRVRILLADLATSGQLVHVDLPQINPLLHFSGHKDPGDPIEQAYLEELERFRREDLERALGEFNQECSNSSSIPTT